MRAHRSAPTWGWVVAALLGATAAACGSFTPAPGTVGQHAPGAARISIEGRDAATKHAIRCHHGQFWTTVEIGDGSRGVVAVVRNSAGLTVESVQIRDVDGFTGSYWTGLGGRASATMSGPTLSVRGIADGFWHNEPSRSATAGFEVAATC